jgi:hypothetical protein
MASAGLTVLPDTSEDLARMIRVCGGGKVGHWSGGVVLLRAE